MLSQILRDHEASYLLKHNSLSIVHYCEVLLIVIKGVEGERSEERRETWGREKERMKMVGRRFEGVGVQEERRWGARRMRV